MSEQSTPAYYDGSGNLTLPVRTSGKDIVVKPDPPAALILYPVFPYCSAAL
jgi:hypothetical protein